MAFVGQIVCGSGEVVHKTAKKSRAFERDNDMVMERFFIMAIELKISLFEALFLLRKMRTMCIGQNTTMVRSRYYLRPCTLDIETRALALELNLSSTIVSKFCKYGID